MSSSDPALVDHAQRLMTFLSRAQAMKTRTAHDIEQYQRDGSVVWWNALPEDPRLRRYEPSAESESPGIAVLTCPRLQLPPPPELPSDLMPWVDGPLDDPRRAPTLRPTPRRGHSKAEDDWEPVEADGAIDDPIFDPPEAVPTAPTGSFQGWLNRWAEWADSVGSQLPLKRLYDQLFDMHVLAEGSAEEYELCLGVGLLTWRPGQDQSVRRHTVTAPLVSSIDERSGAIAMALDESTGGARAELDMLDPSLLTMGSVVRRFEQEAREFEGHPLDMAALEPILSTLATALNSAARFDPSLIPAEASSTPIIWWAPAVILRKRPPTGLVKSFESIAHQIGLSGRVPAGLLPLVDPDSRPPVVSESVPGAMVRTEVDVLSPLPLNEVQLRILDRVDRHAQTLVQGPPGTGKTHTAAALLSHLLAQGKRVLVTAHTDRALMEVRDKLPAQIKPLAVSVIGSSRSDMADLKTAVETIAREASERDPADGDRIVEKALRRIDGLLEERERALHALREARETEASEYEAFGYSGTPAEIARQLQADAPSHSWLKTVLGQTSDSPLPEDAPLPSNADAVRWWTLLQEPGLPQLADDTDHEAVAARLSPADDVATLFERLREAEDAITASGVTLADPVAAALQSLGAADRAVAVAVAEATVSTLAQRSAGAVPDIAQAASDVREGNGAAWRARADRMEQTFSSLDALLGLVPPATQVWLRMDPGTARAMASSLLHDKASENIKTGPDGMPRTGVFTPNIVKQCAPLFADVRINGLPPTSRPALQILLAWLDAVRMLQQLDALWSGPPRLHPSLHEQAAWHRHLLEQLRGVLDSERVMSDADRALARLGMPVPQWQLTDVAATYRRAADMLAARDQLVAAEGTLRSIRDTVVRLLNVEDGVGLLLTKALDERDAHAYRTALAAVEARDRRHERAREFRGLTALIDGAAPGLSDAVRADPSSSLWGSRLQHLTEAINWHDTTNWLVNLGEGELDAGQSRVAHIEEQLRAQVETMAAARAWNHAVAPDRLTGSARADLTQYSQLVRRLGKGTGKYAARQRAEIRRAMDRCRPAVPVWIMPIYRVAEQLDMVENMFDVVLVDEASQAGLEATLLQYLAPRIVVIGDDKQVSPSAVGLDHNQLHRLADQYLFDDRYKSSWEDPRRSLFDEARMRFGGQLTLVEHRRCVPEIIEFSNQIAYEPDGVRLEPVRQLGSSRLAPFRLTHVPSASVRGANINEAEAEALVEALVACVADPEYAGHTMGVISLVGQAQAKHIEGLLAQRLSAEEWSRLQLRCGDAADFQGSERDVMFLSMVSVRSEDRRLAALTQESAVQRFNVAVSRAKDQVWLFHSITLDQLLNTEDLRHRLLAYATGVAQAAPNHVELPQPAPDDELAEPFADLFEQQVFNAIVAKGYLVEPHRVVAAYETSMVIVGAHSSLVVECEGSRWAGAAAHERDLRAQRELERCGWPIVRIRESAFVLNSTSALAGLWHRLDALGIQPHAYPAGDSLTPLEGTPATHVAEDVNADATDVPAQAADKTTTILPQTSMAAEDAPPVPEEHAEQGMVAMPPAPPNAGLPVDDQPEQELPDTPPAVATALPSQSAFHLPAYHSFQGTTVPLSYGERRQIADGLRSIVAVEGPMTGHRLFTVYARSSGYSRLGRDIARSLTDSVRTAVRGGLLLSENPLGSPHSGERTYRLAHQPVALPRLLGPRELTEVPPAEIALVMSMLLQRHGHLSDERLYRETLRAFGRQALTVQARDFLQRVRVRLLG